MFRVDIPEGCESIPRFAWGRILSMECIGEWYATVTLFGFTIFIAAGRYEATARMPQRPYRLRGWTARLHAR